MDGGTITPTGASVGTKQGFSIINYTGNSTADATLSHGLGKTPSLVIVKNLSSAANWNIKTSSNSSGDVFFFTNDGETTTSAGHIKDLSGVSNISFATSSSWGNVNNDGSNYIAYIWANISGVQDFGSYEGNANDDGTFIYTGHRPRIIWMKGIDSSKDWVVIDTARDPYNVATKKVYLNSNTLESASANGQIDILLSLIHI